MLQKLFSIVGSKRDRSAQIYRDIIRREAVVGGKLFGEVPQDVRREFFCLDEHTWVWHEEWIDAQKQHCAVTTRYDVRPNGVLKVQGNRPYRYISLEEARRLYKAVDLYNKSVDAELS